MGSHNDFGKIADGIPARGQQLLDAYQSYWVNIAAQRVLVDTGDLKNSIGPAPGDENDTRKVVAGMDYAACQEYGTVDQIAFRPYMRPARDELAPTFKSDLKRMLKP